MERDLQTLELYVVGTPTRDIQAKLGWATGTSVNYAVRRALHRRIEHAKETVEIAKQLYLDRLEALLHAWMPLATGTFVLDEGEPPARPDPRAADIVLKILAQVAEVEHTTLRPTQSVTGATVNVHNHVYSDQTSPHELRSKIMLQLDQMRTKMRVVDGTFAEVGTTLEQVSEGEDGRDAPPSPLVLPQAPEAA